MTLIVTNLLLADIGLPMVALYVPAAWLALLPIIFIEAMYGARRYKLSFRRTLCAEAAANCFSTIVGIPLTWLGIILVQFATVPNGIGPGWLWPNSTWRSIAPALSVLTGVFYLMSVVTEGFIVRCFFRALPRQALRSWMVRANGISYGFLLVLFVVGAFAPKVARPWFGVMQPVNEAIVDSAFWLGRQIHGDPQQESPLSEAVEGSDVKKAQKLIAAGADANQRNSVGFPVLAVAAGLGDSKMTKLLLDAGANVNARSVTLNDTALSRAAQRGDPETVRLLVQARAELEAKDGSGWTPLFNAALSGNLETVQILLSAGADVNARTPKGWTALKEAQMRGYENITHQLKSAGAIDFPDGSR